MVALARSSQSHSASEEESAFAADVLSGLNASPKRIPAKYFYDDAGSLLFDRITDLSEYYPTRCEMSILEAHAEEVCKLIPEGAALVEFGAGSNKKARILLKAAPHIGIYVPVDICGEMIEREAVELRRDFRKLTVAPITADFTKEFELPPEAKAPPARVGFFPGSTIGNFEPHEAAAFLNNVAKILGPDAILIIGVDLIKPVEVLKAAYNDEKGVTAKFNLNLLKRINRELGGTFDLGGFEHHAIYNRERNRIEMHLASLKRQKVKVAGECFDFRAGETIHTENSYKYSVESLSALARGVGWQPLKVGTDPEKYFSIQALKLEPEGADGKADTRKG
jgi:dimethylhistidine N-methyltransferase